MPLETNPYQSPEHGRKWVGGMRYVEAIRFVFQNPRWLANLALAGLCAMIPVVGMCVTNGYAYEVAETLRLTRGASYPDFNFNRFGGYLMRGLGGFVLQLGAQMVLVGFFLAAIAVILGIAFASGGARSRPPVWLEIAFPVGQFVFQFVSLAAPFAIWPWQFRAGMTEQVGEGFRFQWGFDFLTRNFLELLFASLLCMALACLVVPLGCFLAVIGALPALAFVELVGAHLMWQIHELHVRRDGTPLPWSASVRPFAFEYGHVVDPEATSTPPKT